MAGLGAGVQAGSPRILSVRIPPVCWGLWQAVPSQGRKAGWVGGYLGGVLQDGQQPLLDPPQQLQAGVEVLSPQEAQRGGQVSAVQQRFLCRGGRARGSLPSSLPPTDAYHALPTSTRAHSLEVGTGRNQSKGRVGVCTVDLRGGT